jgi:uncharacterized protein (TIGR02145 family)
MKKKMNKKEKKKILFLIMLGIIIGLFGILLLFSLRNNEEESSKNENKIKVKDSEILKEKKHKVGTMQSFTSSDCASYDTPINTDYTSIGNLTDQRDDKEYKIRKFADNKCWMVSNLMYGGTTDNCSGKFLFSGDGSSTPTNQFGTGTYGDCRDPRVGGSDPCISGSTVCGYYYNWQATMQDASAYYENDYQPTEPTQGICPSGWHVPNKDEFVALDIATGGSGANRTDSTNQFWRESYAFKGFYSGSCDSSGSLSYQGSSGYWWSSSQYSSTYAYYLYLHSSYVHPQNYGGYKCGGFTVRCLKN